MLLIVLVIGAVMWSLVFNLAALDFLAGERPLRSSWNGVGEFDFFGYTVSWYYEGWADHDYYYVTWADQFLAGYMPYTESFDNPIVGGTEYYIPYFFPPLYVYICVFGRLFPIHPLGVGLIICAFGYLTTLPVYGITEYLSGRRDVAIIAAATYLFNPLIIYHTVVQWLNPAPFVFFTMLSFFLLMRGKRNLGVLAMVTAALLKQTAFFFAFPLIAYMIKRPPGAKYTDDEDTESNGSDTSAKRRIIPSDRTDLVGFAKTVLLVILYVGIVSLPYLYDVGNYAFNIFQRAGSTNLEDFTSAPDFRSPITIAVPFIVLGAPEWFSMMLNSASYFSIGLIIGILPLFVLMMFEEKDDTNLQGYWRRILYFTLLMMLWVHIWSPRGIYKYYCVLLIPMFSILSASRMCQKDGGPVGFSIVMAVVPAFFSVLILFPDRNLYLLYIVLIFLFYVLHKPLGKIAAAMQRTLRRVYPKTSYQSKSQDHESGHRVQETVSSGREPTRRSS